MLRLKKKGREKKNIKKTYREVGEFKIECAFSVFESLEHHYLYDIGLPSFWKDEIVTYMICICGPQDNEKTIEIAIPYKRKVFFMLSSGADSSILLYLACLSLLEENRQPDSELQYIFTLPKVDGAEDHAENIVRWINQKLKINLPMPILDAPPDLKKMHHNEMLWKSLDYIIKKYRLSFAFMGDQQTVPPPYKISEEYPKRFIPNPYPEFIGMPFENLDKSHTIDLHFRYGTLELLALTHSCTQQRAGRCEKCYHCLERKWAFERLKQVDPGTN